MKRLNILFFDNSTLLQNVRDLEVRARGGMVASLFKVSDYLSNQGHEVSVLAGIEESGQTKAGVKWVDAGNFGNGNTYDVLVCNRGIGDGYPAINASRRILWTHDLPHSGFIPEPKTMKAFTATVFMSAYAERVWRAFYPTIGRSFTIPNGVDKTIFHPREKVLGNLIFASAPNRGLNRLPLIYGAIHEVTGATMQAFTNMEKMHPGEVRGPDPHIAQYQECRDAGIDLSDPIPQHELADHLGRAALMILPTDYPEICSNIILQSLASGTPIVTTGNLGSAGEWIRHKRNGWLTQFQPHDYMIHSMEMVRGALTILESDKLHRSLIHGAGETKIDTWDEIGAKWDKMIRMVV